MPSISIIIPALNEEKNLPGTIEEVCRGLNGNIGNYEILIFNDGSSDKTGFVADELARNNKNIKVIHNPTTKGLGYNYKKGIELARNDYIVMFPGDNAFPWDSIRNLINHVGKADIIIPYTKNTWARPFSRRIISRAFVELMNLLFGLNLRYYNGTVVHKREIVQKVPIDTNGFAYQAAILTRLIRSGYTYKEVGMELRDREFGGSKAFAPKNVLSVIKTIASLFWEVNVKG